MITKKIAVYVLLLSAVFLSLFFITMQNKHYHKIHTLEQKLYKQMEIELVQYKENLYRIEQMKTELKQEDADNTIEVESLYLDKEEANINDIEQKMERL